MSARMVFVLLVWIASSSSSARAWAFQSSSTTSTRMLSTSFTALRSTTSSSSDSSKRRVVVTGLGVVNGCGIGAVDFFQNVVDGKSSIDTVRRFDSSNYPCQIGSEVPDAMFDANDHFSNPKNAKSNDRYTHFAVAAARQALQDAGLGDTPETLLNAERVGCMVGTAFGGLETIEREILKLAKKPDRPKVCCVGARTVERTFIGLRFTNSPLFPLPDLNICNIYPNDHRFRLLPCPPFCLTQHPAWSPLNAVAGVPIMASCQRVPPAVTPLVKPWG
jgi:hypothetical protein